MELFGGGSTAGIFLVLNPNSRNTFLTVCEAKLNPESCRAVATCLYILVVPCVMSQTILRSSREISQGTPLLSSGRVLNLSDDGNRELNLTLVKAVRFLPMKLLNNLISGCFV